MAVSLNCKPSTWASYIQDLEMLSSIFLTIPRLAPPTAPFTDEEPEAPLSEYMSNLKVNRPCGQLCKSELSEVVQGGRQSLFPFCLRDSWPVGLGRATGAVANAEENPNGRRDFASVGDSHTGLESLGSRTWRSAQPSYGCHKCSSLSFHQVRF